MAFPHHLRFPRKQIRLHRVTPDQSAVFRFSVYAMLTQHLADLFGQGKLAMVIGPNGIPTYLKDGGYEINYGVSTIPTNTGTSTAQGVMDRFMVFDNDDDETKLAAISTFFDTFYDDDPYSEWVLMEDFLPATSTGAEAMVAVNESYASWIDILSNARFYPTAKAEWIDVKQGVIDVEQQALLGGDVKGLLLLDVTPLSLGIETLGGVFTKLIERNTTIPTKKSQVFSTAADNQTSVEVHVLQGEREMAAYNKTLGKFQLTGIAPARRGVPQIEVSFDIDANGIVNVSAKDLGTGQEQAITITASSNLSKEDIDKAVREAEQYASEDKARKDEADARNNADQIIYQSQQTLSELGDKVSAEEKAPIEAAISDLQEKLKGTDVEAIKSATEAVTQAFYAISEKLYANQAQADQGAPTGGTDAPGGSDDGYVDADFEEVD